MAYYQIDSAFIPYMEQLGINVERLLKKSNIQVHTSPLKGITLTKEQYIAFMKSASEIMTDQQIIEFCNIDKMMLFIPPIFASMCSKDGKHCFQRIAQYKKLIGPFAILITETKKTLRLTFVMEDPSMDFPRFTILNEQILMVNTLRKATGLHIQPSSVGSNCEYGPELIDFFGIQPEYSQPNFIEFTHEDLAEPFLTQNNTMWSYLEPELRKRMEELEVDNSFAAKVRSVLFEMIPAGEISAEAVSKSLAISVRTLQRKLSSEDTTFIKQLNHTRELLARHYLKKGRMSNDDIAFLIGYSDANAFQRAFRNWTGQTIGQYKKSSLAG
jgi:AraC-like DNA-binding protein